MIRDRIVELATAAIGKGGPEPWATEAGLRLAPKDRPQWCGIFARAIWRRAGLACPDWIIGSGNVSYLRKLSAGERAKPGDLAAFAGFGHQALVSRDEGGDLDTIDGNTAGGLVAAVRRNRAKAIALYSIDPLLAHVRKVEPSPGIVGIDVSDVQDPEALDYLAAAASGVRWCYVKVTDGIDATKRAAAHVAKARAAGLHVGGYVFFIPWRTAAEHVTAYSAAAKAAGLGPRDLPPVLDVESWRQSDPDPTVRAKRAASRAWAPNVAATLEALAAAHGRALRYHNAADWAAMGRPAELRAFDLWLADYSGAPDLDGWIAWQHEPRIFPGVYPHPIDWSVAHASLLRGEY